MFLSDLILEEEMQRHPDSISSALVFLLFRRQLLIKPTSAICICHEIRRRFCVGDTSLYFFVSMCFPNITFCLIWVNAGFNSREFEVRIFLLVNFSAERSSLSPCYCHSYLPHIYITHALIWSFCWSVYLVQQPTVELLNFHNASVTIHPSAL